MPISSVLTLERCSVSENHTGQGGNPAGAGGSGGGIFNSGATLVLTNVTVAGNLAGDGAPTAASAGGNGGGIFHNLGSLALIHCTVADNHSGQSLGGTPSRGGGIFKNTFGTLTIRNTIIADNTAPGSGDDVAGSGTFTATDRNFVEDYDITSSGGIHLSDPALDVLADNGGPTRTIRLLTGSSAIDWALPSDPTVVTDQRGVARTFGAPDVGAYEADGGSIVVNTLTDENDGMETNGISLRDALTEGIPHSRITFDPVVFGGTNPTIVLSHSELSMIGPFVVDASALPGGLTIDAEGRSRVFRNRRSGSGASLIGIVLTGGNIASSGGGIQNDDMLILTACTVSGNSSSNYGGGIVNAGTLIMTACTVSGNSSSGQGGGIFDGTSATLTLRRCTVSANSASAGGGGIFVSQATIDLSDSIIAGNSSTSGDQNLSVDSTSSIGMLGDNLISGDPRLAPLGNYGGPTLTMPPLPGSPAIDGCLYSDHNPDQRGFPRPIDGDGSGDARADIGAVEYNPHLDLPRFWGLDWDGDGSSFGTEYALGTDPLVSDPGNPRNPGVSFGDGSVGLGFGIDSSARTFCQWVVLRSTDLSPGSWLEIYRRYGPTGAETLAPGFSSAHDNPDQPASVIITEETPSSPAAFYRLAAEFVPDGPS